MIIKCSKCNKNDKKIYRKYEVQVSGLKNFDFLKITFEDQQNTCSSDCSDLILWASSQT